MVSYVGEGESSLARLEPRMSAARTEAEKRPHPQCHGGLIAQRVTTLETHLITPVFSCMGVLCGTHSIVYN